MDKVRLLLAVAFVLASQAAFAACGPVSTCPTATTPLSGTELLYIIQNGASSKITASALAASLNPLQSIAAYTILGNSTSAMGPVTTISTNAAAIALLGGASTGTGGLVGKTSPTIASPTVTGSFTATGLVSNADLANSSTTVNGTACALGAACTVTSAAASVTVGSTTIGSGTSGDIEFNNGGVLGEKAVTGSGNVVLATAPTLSTPALGTPSAVNLANATNLPNSALQAGAAVANLGYTPLNAAATTLPSNFTASSLTSVGTVASGVWQGTLVGPTYGGTGANNGSNVLTVSATGTAALTNVAQTITAAKTFNNSDLLLLGSSTGATTFTSANASATAYTLTFPAISDTLVTLSAVQALTNKSIVGTEINSGTVNGAYLAAINLAGGNVNGGVTGNLPVANLNGGASASSTTFWRGDGTWAAPSGSGTVNSGTAGQLAYYASSTNAVSSAAGASISGGNLTLTQSGGVIVRLLDSANTAGSLAITAAGGTNYFESFLTATGGSVAPIEFTGAFGSPVLMTIGTNGAVGAAYVNLTAANNGVGFVTVTDQTVGGTDFAANFYKNGASVGTIAITNTTTAYNTTSDRRRKESIAPTQHGLSDLMKIKVADFNFKADPSRRVQGFIAQDLNKVYPEAVTPNGDDGVKPLAKDAKPWAVDYGRVTPLLVRSIQDMQEEIAELRAANDNLGERLNRLERRAAR